MKSGIVPLAVAVAALSLAAALAVLLWPAPAPPQNCASDADQIVSQRCLKLESAYISSVWASAYEYYGFLLWFVEVAAICSVPPIIAVFVDRGPRPGLKVLAALGALLGVWFFVSFAAVDVVQETYSVGSPWLASPSYLGRLTYEIAAVPDLVIGGFNPAVFALLTLSALSFATVCLGAIISLRKAFFRFAAPAATAFLGVLLLIVPADIPSHVTNFLDFEVGGVQVFSNGLALAVCACLTFYGAVAGRHEGGPK